MGGRHRWHRFGRGGTRAICGAVFSAAAVMGGTSVGAQDAVGADGPTGHASLNQQVQHLFEQRCGECHGTSVAKPKEFGYIDDLPRLSADPALVTPGDPDRSELVFQIEAGLMPPDDSGIPPLDANEVALVRQWVEGLPEAEAPPDEEAGQAASKPGELLIEKQAESEPAAGLSTGDRWLRWLGKFHPASVHFPIAFLIGALIAEFWRVTSGRESMLTVTRFCLWMGALSAAPAAVLGWLHAAYGGYGDWARLPSGNIDIHRWLGVSTAIGAWLVLGLYELRLWRNSPRLRTYFQWSLLVLAVLAVATGFFGGLVTYGGLSHYAF